MSSRTNRGFTLIEVMVSLAIMAMVVTVAFSGLRIGLDSWERGSRAIDDIDNRLTVERLLKRQLALAYPTPVTIDEQTYAMFRGTGTRMEFVSDYSLGDGPGDFRKIDYAFEDGLFLYGERSMFGYMPTQREELPMQGLANFRTVSFRYLGLDDQRRPVWMDRWDLSKQFPIAVQIQIDDDIFVVRLVNREQ